METNQKISLLRMIRRLGWILPALLFAAPTYAVVCGAGTFDRLTSEADAAVKARITWIDPAPPFEHIAFTAEVILVLGPGDGEIPETFAAEVPFPLWPRELAVPYREGELVILILSRRTGELRIVNNLNAILPTVPNPEANLEGGDAGSLEERLVGELLAYIDYAADDIPERPGIPGYGEELPPIIVTWEEQAQPVVREALAWWGENHD